MGIEKVYPRGRADDRTDNVGKVRGTRGLSVGEKRTRVGAHNVALYRISAADGA